MLWDVATRKRLLEDPLPVKVGGVHSVAFSPDGKTLAAGYSPARRRCGAVGRGHPQTPPGGSPPRDEGGVESVAFSPDGKTLAAGYVGATAAGWCCGTWRPERLPEDPLPVKEGYVHSVAFSPDGKTLAAGYGRRRRRRRGAVGRGHTQTPPGGSPPRERGLRLQRGLQPRRQDPHCRIRRRTSAAAWCCGTWPPANASWRIPSP